MAQLKNPGRLIGTVVPVGALRGNESIGVGEFPDLVEFGALCKEMGIKLIQLLPVNDTGEQDSPYFALTAFALHPLYLRISELPEVSAGAKAAEFKAKIKALKDQFDGKERFPYLDILRAKIALLREIYEASSQTIVKNAKGKSPLANWIKANPWVKPYAVYRQIKKENLESTWKDWPAHQKVTPADIDALWNDPALEEKHLFWVWIQEALDRQFSKAAKSLSDMGLILEGDIPILMNEDSCDVWAHPEIFNLDLSAGAPPDMYSPDGQNWGFPTFNWTVQEKDDYAWWKARLKTAEKYYSAYRIDHVLGFFRIWTSRREDSSNNSVLGRFIPYVSITTKDLTALKFDSNRIKWVSQPHIPTNELIEAIAAGWKDKNDYHGIQAAADKVFREALERIGHEELWLFKESIRGSKDLEILDLHPAAKEYLEKAWGNRLFFEYEKGSFVATWLYRDSRAYHSLSKEEQDNVEALIKDRQTKSERIWEKEGRKLLTILAGSSSMLPCAEDLGAVPACVPKVLKELEILGLRVVRWHRDWEKEGQPYYPFEDYPELSVCTPAVHDTSTLREWWDKEADQAQFAGFLGFPSLPKVYNPGTAKSVLFKIATAASRFRVFQFQELLHLSPKWYSADPASDRINVPGTLNEFNWTWRLPAVPGEIAKDKDLVNTVKELAEIPAAVKKTAKKPAAKKSK